MLYEKNMIKRKPLSVLEQELAGYMKGRLFNVYFFKVSVVFQ